MPITQWLTVARLRPSADGDDIEVMFLESSRIYVIRATNSARQRVLAVLQDAMRSHRRVSVTYTAIGGAEITEVHMD